MVAVFGASSGPSGPSGPAVRPVLVPGQRGSGTVGGPGPSGVSGCVSGLWTLSGTDRSRVSGGGRSLGTGPPEGAGHERVTSSVTLIKVYLL